MDGPKAERWLRARFRAAGNAKGQSRFTCQGESLHAHTFTRVDGTFRIVSGVDGTRRPHLKQRSSDVRVAPGCRFRFLPRGITRS